MFYLATVVGEEALGEYIQQLLQPIVSYSVQYNQQYDRTLVVLHSHTFSMSKRRRANQFFHRHLIYTPRDSIAVAYVALE